MSETSGGLPLMAQTQNSRYLTFNESMWALNVLQTGVLDRNLNTPPGSPTEGDAYIVASGGTAAWAGHDDDIAFFFEGIWNFLEPQLAQGRGIWVDDEAVLIRWSIGSPGGWIVVGDGDASTLTYTPSVLADWDGSLDPGDVGDALDQLAERVTDLEGVSGIGGSTGATDNRVLRSDGAGGATLQSSGVTLDDSNNVSGVAALSATTIELGHASDTTLTRVSAGVAAIEGQNILTAATGQPLDSDLTAIAGLSPSNDDVVQRKAGAWTNRTIAQLATDITAANVFQPLDSDLTTIAGLTATTDNFLQSVSSAWASRTPAQAAATLQSTGLVADMVGFRTVPSNSQSTAYTTVAADSGKSIDHPSTDANARTFTIDSNANVAYPVGTCISFSNMTSQAVTIAITSDTMYLAGAGTTGSRTLAQYGTATARKLTSTSWIISGVGLT